MIKKILVSQPKPSSDKSPYYDIATDLGVELVFRPFFKVEGLSAKEFRQQKVNLLDYTAVVFTSRHAVDNYFNLAKEMRITIPEDMKYFCVIETIALYIQKYVQYRKRKVFFGNTGKSTASSRPCRSTRWKNTSFRKAPCIRMHYRSCWMPTSSSTRSV